MPIYSGKDAYVNGVSCTQAWQATPATTHQRYSASCVPGGTNTPPGIINWSGQASGVGGQPILFPDGVDRSFQGVVNNTGGSLKSLTGNILVEQLTIDINKETYAPIGWVATFGAQGALTEGASGATDTSDADAPNGKDLLIKIGGSTISPSVRSAQLVFRRPHTTYVDGGLTYRKAGNLECDINFAVYESSVAVAAYAANALDILQVYVSSTLFWSFKKIRFGGKTGFSVDRPSNNIIGYTVNGQWNGHDAGEVGWILGPDGTEYYGEGP